MRPAATPGHRPASATARRRKCGAPAEGYARERKVRAQPASATARRRKCGAPAEGYARERK
jgi:hypothetical protein